MRLYIKVIPKSSHDEIIKISDFEYKVRLNAVPEKNKANLKLIEILSEKFKTSKSSIRIIAGKTARTKIVDIEL